MKIYLASYLEPDKHGPGKLYAIASTKPQNVEVHAAYKFFIPTEDMMEEYRTKQLSDQLEAAKFFNDAFRTQLNMFTFSVKEAAEEENKKPHELLPFEDGDTLACWEREGYTSYRHHVAECLMNLGYEVVLR